MRIDLSAELGHSLDELWCELEDGFWPLVTSVAIPCVGDPSSMLAAGTEASRRGIAIGAALGYRDPLRRGERFVDDDPDALAADLLFQLGGLDALIAGESGNLRFIRPSGALFEAVRTNRGHAWAVVNAVLDFDPSLVVVGLPGSALLVTATRQRLRVATEHQPHRLPGPGGSLGPVVTDPAVIAERAVAAADKVDLLRLSCRSSADIVAARAVRAALERHGCALQPYEPTPGSPEIGRSPARGAC